MPYSSRMRPEKYVMARKMRKNMTEPERILWEELRNRKLSGFKFLRQRPCLGFILDFYCHEARLDVEVDGKTHEETVSYDRTRDAALARVRITTLRIPAAKVYNDLPSALESIRRAAFGR